MSALAQLAEHLGLSSDPGPAPATPPVHPAANDPMAPQTAPEATSEPVRAAPARHTLTAATASPEWRQSRDQYMNHLMACRACHAPTGRYCQTGDELRAIYDSTPMEPTL